MSKNNNVSLNTCVIPVNFVDTGRCFNGMFKTRNLIEAVIAAFPIAYYTTHLNVELNHKIVLTAILAGPVFLGFVTGVNGDSVLEFLVNFLKYQKKKRVSKYNPRVKLEATPGYLTKEQAELPRDKIARLLGDAKVSEEEVSKDIYDPIYQEFFADDMGYVETPQDLKTKKELRKEAKQAKRLLKIKKREAKKHLNVEKKSRKEQEKNERKKRRKERA